jgi:hypothetical protein
MKAFSFSLPQTDVLISFPEEMEKIILRSFSLFQKPEPVSPRCSRFRISRGSTGYDLYKDEKCAGSFESALAVYGALENEVETLLIKSSGEWVTFHAGCVRVGEGACLIAGKPEAGKTSTTFIMVEMGKDFLCEEMAPVEPLSRLVHPFPLPLSMSRTFAKEYGSCHSVKKGRLEDIGNRFSQYVPHRAWKRPLPLRMIILPFYNPGFTPDMVSLSPGEALPDVLECCFPPKRSEEKLFDSVINLVTGCQIFRLFSNGIEATKDLVRRLTYE